ncbi:MAG: TolC family protein, partial [Syntrophobacteraceae bacterium]|nr:TolC family protein [Syntrophobacteraceae bacterium]
NKVKKAKAEYERLLHTKEFAEQNIPVQVSKYYQDAVESKESYEAYEKGAVSARKWVVAAFANFDFGVGSARDLFDAIDRYGKNQGEYLLSLYNYNVALANLSDAIAEYRTAGR